MKLHQAYRVLGLAALLGALFPVYSAAAPEARVLSPDTEGAAPVSPSPLTESVPPSRVPADMLGDYRHRINPIVPERATLAKARLLFVANCRVCHGMPAEGTPVEPAVAVPPRDFSSPGFQEARSDGELFYVIENGIPGTPMRSWQETLSEREMWMLVTFIRTLAPPPVP